MSFHTERAQALANRTRLQPICNSRQQIANRETTRTGVVTSLDKLTADHLSTLLNKVLYNSPYRDNARRMQKAIAEANGLSAAVDIIEQCIGERARALANSV